MDTTFVGVGPNGFSIEDSLLGLWLRFLALHLEDQPDALCLANRIRNDWLLASRCYFPCCVPFDLQTDVSTEEGKALVLQAVESLMADLASGPPLLERNTLHVLGMEPRFSCDIESAQLIEVGKAFLALIQGKQPSIQLAAMTPRQAAISA